MKLKTNIILTFLFLVFGAINPGFSQKKLNNLNQALRYSRYSRIGLKIIPIKESDTEYKLQMAVEKIEENPSFNTFSFSYMVLNSYEEDISDDQVNLLTQNDLKYDTDRHWYFEKTVTVPSDQEIAVALLTVLDTRQGDEYYYHIDLKSPFVSEQPNFGAYYANDIPFDQNFITKGQSLLFKSVSGPSIHEFYYPVTFDVPFPPMETKPASVSKELDVVDNGDFLTNVPESLENEGYYFYQSDTSSGAGLLLKTTNEAFPKVKDWEEMIQMVTYISTRKEHEALLLAEDKKKALDEYWYNLTRNPDLAKDLIREYFRQIEFANILFTDFKEGWKTDRGMVYTVMGPPTEVNFYLDREVWSYGGLNESSKIRFTFVRVKNILTPHYYSLNRSRAYQPVWFKNISIWRSGKMAF